MHILVHGIYIIYSFISNWHTLQDHVCIHMFCVCLCVCVFLTKEGGSKPGKRIREKCFHSESM